MNICGNPSVILPAFWCFHVDLLGLLLLYRDHKFYYIIPFYYFNFDPPFINVFRLFLFLFAKKLSSPHKIPNIFCFLVVILLQQPPNTLLVSFSHPPTNSQALRSNVLNEQSKPTHYHNYAVICNSIRNNYLFIFFYLIDICSFNLFKNPLLLLELQKSNYSELVTNVFNVIGSPIYYLLTFCRSIVLLRFLFSCFPLPFFYC
jgi:hypothetical protein